MTSARLLSSHLAGVVLLFAARDAASFVLHRISQRMTNHAAEVLFSVPVSSMANPFWLILDPKFLEAHLGYQVCIAFFFLLALPVNILINATAFGAAALLCTDSLAPAAAQLPEAAAAPAGAVAEPAAGVLTEQGSAGAATQATASFACAGPGRSGLASFRLPAQHAATGSKAEATGASGGSSGGSRASASSSSSSRSRGQLAGAAASTSAPAAAAPAQKRGVVAGARAGAAAARAALAAARPLAAALWATDVRLTLMSLPLQAAMLLVLPAGWALPRLLAIQLSLPAAALGGVAGAAALERSRALMDGFRAAYAWPFFGLLAAARLLDLAKQLVLLAMPARWWADVVEVPIAATAAFALARLLAARLQDLLPLAAYLTRVGAAQPPAAGGGLGGGGGKAAGTAGG